MSRWQKSIIGIGVVIVVGAGVVMLAPVVRGQEQPRRDRAVIRIPDVQAIVQRAIAGRQIGVEIRDLRPDDKKGESGVLVTGVTKDSPAEKAGMKEGDVITSFDGERVRSAAQFQRLVRETAPGHAARATLQRDGKPVDLTVTPEETRMGSLEGGDLDRQLQDQLRGLRPDGERMRELEEQLRQRFGDRNFNFRFEGPEGRDWSFDWDSPQDRPRSPFAPPPGTPRGQLGVTVQELTPQLGDYFGTRDGVLITGVQDKSPAAQAGLKAGDVITAIDGRAVRNRADLTRELRSGDANRTVEVEVMRDRKTQTLKVKLGAEWKVVPIGG